ncbi:MAG TPA: ABC transporter permease subunit, partial [Clostridia bacterium]|nr:ABC transporter permease subunit [Clostridia bacterium]
AMGHPVVRFMTEPSMFRPLYILSGIWQTLGWNSIIFIAAITGIDQELYEAAIVDGATKFRRMLHITIPCILPTIIIMLILRLGSVMSVGFDKVFLMQNDLTLETSEIISTYVYKTGLVSGRYDYAAAIGVFNSVINFALLVVVNKVADKVSGTSLW